ncbi:hypothetical protein [Paenibacillus agaridevorans]|uniref:hypothetical protein n=1 Tax=Paenibacillus agaridevorans TaxID=171404 RepID=UPI001BE4BA54|nr:hypothetical protein [Paenibacillus agaridevorans]
MKATINGIEVEGTPREIHELMVEMGPVKFKPVQTPLPVGIKQLAGQHPQSMVIKDLFVGWPTIAKQSKCPSNGPCYCTGACMK